MMKIETFEGIVHVHKTDHEFHDKEKVPLVRFDSHRHPFLMLEQYCGNPDCDCNEAILGFTEIDETESPIANPMRFRIYLDLRTWQENRRPKRSEFAQRIVDEFTNSLTDDMRSRFRDSYEHVKEKARYVKEKARNAARFKMHVDEIYSGVMVSYADVFGDSGSVLSGGKGAGFRFECEGKDYLIEDVYCINPKCKCKATRLVFLEFCKETKALSDLFDSFLDFRKGLEIKDHPGCTKEDAQNISEEWQKSNPNLIDVVKYRYDEMKKVGRRLVAKDDGHMTKYSATDDRKKKIGRNDPCPCGSGLKFKRCCLRK